MRVDDLLESVSRDMPEGWQIRIWVENGAAGVLVERPDGSIAAIDSDEAEIEQLIKEALWFINDEMLCDRLRDPVRWEKWMQKPQKESEK